MFTRSLDVLAQDLCSLAAFISWHRICIFQLLTKHTLFSQPSICFLTISFNLYHTLKNSASDPLLAEFKAGADEEETNHPYLLYSGTAPESGWSGSSEAEERTTRKLPLLSLQQKAAALHGEPQSVHSDLRPTHSVNWGG